MTKEKIIAFIKSILWMFAKKRGVDAEKILSVVYKAKAKAEKKFEFLAEGVEKEIENLEENERQLFLMKQAAQVELRKAKQYKDELYTKIGL